MNIKPSLFAFIACMILATPSFTQENLMPSGSTDNAGTSEIAAPDPQPGRMSGTATNVNDDVIPGANVILNGPALEGRRTVVQTTMAASLSTISNQESFITSQ